MRFAHGCPDYFALAQKSGLSYIGVVAALQRGRQSLTPPRGSRSGRPPLSLPPSEVDRNLGPVSSLLRRALFLFRQWNAGPASFQLASVFPIGRRLSNGFARRYLRALVGPVAQWLELAAHNGLVAGSSPAGPTIFRMSGQGGQGCPPICRGGLRRLSRSGIRYGLWNCRSPVHGGRPDGSGGSS